MNFSQKRTGALISYFALILNSLLKLIYTPFLLISFGQQEYGLYSLAMTIVGYLMILDMGLGNTIVRFTLQAKTEGDKTKLHKLYGLIIILYVCIGILAFCIACLLSFFSTSIFGKSMTADEVSTLSCLILIVGINLLISFPLQIAVAVVISYEKFIVKNTILLMNIVITPILMVLGIIFFDYKSIEAITVISSVNIIQYFLLYIYAYRKLDLKPDLKNIDWGLLTVILSFSSSVFLLIVFEQFQYNIGQLLLGVFSGTRDIAIWGISMIFVLNFRSISSAITNVFTPDIVTKLIKNENEAAKKTIYRFTRYQCLVLIVVLLNFLLFGKKFLLLWAGDEYLTSYYIAIILLIPMTIGLLLDFTKMIQTAKKNFRWRIFSLFSTYVISFLLIIPKFGVSLFSIAFSIGLSIFLGRVICNIIYIYKNTDISLNKIMSEIIKLCFVPVLISIIFYFILNTVIINTWLFFVLFVLMLNAILFVSIYFISMNSIERQSLLKKY